MPGSFRLRRHPDDFAILHQKGLPGGNNHRRHPESFRHRAVLVGDQREWQRVFFLKLLLRFRRITTDPDHLNPERFQVHDRVTQRARLRRAPRRVRLGIKIDERDALLISRTQIHRLAILINGRGSGSRRTGRKWLRPKKTQEAHIQKKKDGELTESSGPGLHRRFHMTDSTKRYQGWWIFATAIAVAVFQNAPEFLARPNVAFAQSVWAMEQTPGWREAWITGLARDHGLDTALFVNTTLTFFLQLVLVLAAATVFWFMCRRTNLKKLWRMSWIACAAVTLFSGVFFAWQIPGLVESRKMDSRLLLPLDLAAWADQRTGLLFANPSALPVLEPLTAPTRWLPLAEAAEVMVDPLKWRQLDQKKHFGAVVLNGRLPEYAPLLQHLLASPEWSLAYVDNFGIGFLRGQQLWQPQTPDEVAARFAQPRDAAGYLSQTALSLSLLGKNGDAVRYFDFAEKLAPHEAETYARKAVFLNSRNQFGDAIAAADQALALNPDMLSALQIKSLALLNAQQAESAWKTALKLAELAPEDPYSQFIFARCANGVRAYSAESDALEKVITLSEKRGLPVTNYRIFLAQSFAHRGLSEQALAQFRLAEKDPANSAKQKQEIAESIANIEAQIGAKK